MLKNLPGKTIILGVLDLSDMAVESPETVAARIRRALPRDVAYGKMAATVKGAALVRPELGGT